MCLSNFQMYAKSNFTLLNWTHKNTSSAAIFILYFFNLRNERRRSYANKYVPQNAATLHFGMKIFQNSALLLHTLRLQSVVNICREHWETLSKPQRNMCYSFQLHLRFQSVDKTARAQRCFATYHVWNGTHFWHRSLILYCEEILYAVLGDFKESDR